MPARSAVDHGSFLDDLRRWRRPVRNQATVPKSDLGTGGFTRERCMREIFWAPVAALALSGCASDTPRTLSAPAQGFDALVVEFTTAWDALSLPPLELSFVSNLQALGSVDALQQQSTTFRRLDDQLAAIDASALDACRRIELSVMQTESRLWRQRAQLGVRQLRLDEDYSASSSLAELALGRQWYRYFLERWHGTELDPDALYEFGERELAAARARFDSVGVALGFADADTLLQHLENNSARVAGGEPARELFEARQAQVWQHLSEQFAGTYEVEPARIERSARGAEFPVPGYYDLSRQTFYYNVLDEAGYEARQADWLFLHEATPGHHFQVAAARTSARCPQRLPEVFYAAYVEGWAAYVETIGAELGLYTDPYAELAAIEWDMVRSVRVVLDVGLNAYGWSDEQALDYWHTNVYGQRDVAEREIARMKRWPAQVVTYKYGADVFRRLRERHVGNEKMDVRRFHDAALAYGSMPLGTFEALFPVLAGG